MSALVACCGLLIAAGPTGAASFPEAVSLADLGGSDGAQLDGVDVGDECGASVAAVGDVNDDGVDDLLLGAPGAGSAGEAYVVFGADVFPALDELDGSNGFVVRGAVSGGRAGASVAPAGDLNADGIPDLVVAAPDAGAGESYVVFGSDAGFPAEIDVSSLDGSDGLAIVGVSTGDGAGTVVASAGDVNDDGIDDLILGAPRVDSPGTVASEVGAGYVVFGSDSAFAATVELSALDGTDGFAIRGVDELDRAGASVAAAGDLNGDGIGDVILGAPDGDPVSRDGAGEVYVLFGRDDGFDAVVEASELDGVIGFVLRGAAVGDAAGSAVASIGDFNGDGFGDLAIGAPNAAAGSVAGAGVSYVVFGDDEFASRVELSELEGGRDGLALPGAGVGEGAGGSVGTAGDVNGDSLDDLLIGARSAESAAGVTYLVYGTSDLLAPVVELAELTLREGTVIEGAAADDHSGASVASAGDLDGDGLDDVLVGAPATAAAPGDAYVVYGQPQCRVSAVCGLDRLAAQTFAGPLWTSFPGEIGEAGQGLEDQYLVGDWDGDSCADLAVRRDNLILMSVDDDGFHDLEIRYGGGNSEEQYLVGDWNQDGCDDLAVRRHNLLYMDSDFDGFHDLLPRFGLGSAEDDYLIGDYNGDRGDDLVVRRDTRLFRDLFPWDAVTDNETKYGFGNSEDQYLVGHWSFPPGSQQTFAVRRGNEVLMNFDFDPMHDFVQRFGRGQREDEYLVGDWNGDGRDNLGVRRGNRVLIDTDYDGLHDAVRKFGTGTR